jgi:ATP-binding cassette, subfamily B, multidrug efflux pump
MYPSLYRSFLGIIRQYQWRFFSAFLFAVLANSLQVLNPLIFRQAVLAVDINEPEEITLIQQAFSSLFGSYYSVVWGWAVMLLSIACMSAVFKYSMRIGFISISREVENQVREKVFTKLQVQSRKFYDEHTIGELLSLLTNDITVYRDVLGPGIMYPVFALTLLVPGIVALFYISAPLASLSLLPLLLIPFTNKLVRHRIYSLSAGLQKKLAELSGLVQEHFSGIRIIKGYGAEYHQNQVFAPLADELASVTFKTSIVQGLIFPFFTLLTRCTTVLLVMLSASVIYKGWGELNTADFVSFMWIQSYIYVPVLMLGWVLPIYERGRAAYDRILAIYNEPIDVQDSEKVSESSIPEGADIEFQHLTFSYPTAERKILTDICLSIKGGAFVGITGPVAAGKSTLLKLLDREYEIPEGMILIGGKDIHSYPLSAFHQQVSTVEQMPFLFSRSIADNVRFGSQEASYDEVEVVSRYADLHEAVSDFPDQYETIVGERGVTLSGGQKQRVAIARAFLVDRSILLLDDIFSAVDASTEKKIFQAIENNYREKTILLVTQRVSVLDRLDRVLYMQDGEVVEDGPPEVLKKQKGHYWALSELQRIDFHKGGK